MKTLPENPNLEYLRREARALKALHRAHDTSACRIIGHYDTAFHNLSPDEFLARKFSILDAQRVTARLYSFASWRRLKLFVQKSTLRSNDFNGSLRNDLIKRNVMRQALLRRAKNRKPDSISQLNDFNNESQVMLERLYQQYGWLGPQIVGRDGTEACYWLGVSHSGNASFQHKSAMLMKDSLPEGECYGIQYAVTIDRWLCLSYQPTLYGSFNDFNKASGFVEYTSDVIDRKNLNKRRAEVGLPDFDTANKEIRQRAIKQNWPKYKQQEWQKMKRQWAIEGGYISA